jgi:polyisoprenoid-binding protein YceI
VKTIVMTGLALAIALPAAAQNAQWQVDPAHSSAQFAVKHLGISTVRGTFTKVSGTVTYDPASPATAVVDVSIDAASVDTRVSMRDNDLRSDHFFDVQKYPTMTFKSTRVESASPERLRVIGDLTIHGITKQVTLDVEGPSKPINDGMGHMRMGASANATIDRTQFGVSGAPSIVGNIVTLTIDTELIQPGPAAR